MKNKLFLALILSIVTRVSFSQVQDTLKKISLQEGSPSVPIEVFAGDQGVTFQLIVSKQFSEKSRFGFFNVTTFSGDYKKINQGSAFYSQSVLTARLCKGISAIGALSTVGSSNPSIITVRPTAGLQYLFANRNFVIVILPRFDLSQTYNFETFAVFEYTPSLSEKWAVYTRVQGLYNYNTNLDCHEVSSIYARLGLSYKNFQFGVGSNHDFFGPENYNVNNYGLFIRTNLF